jgi:hypothetical protein
MQTFSYEFEELPLVIDETGIEAAFINGQAEVEYSRDGEWQITGVSVEGFGERVDGKRQWPQVPAPAVLKQIIADRLNDEWRGKVGSAVSDQIAEDRECAAEYRAEQRREDLILEAIR